jgi:hypothetical protein
MSNGKSLSRVMRILHRDIGFFLIGLTLIYCLSGIVLTYRDSSLFKSEKVVSKTIEAGLSSEKLRKVLHEKRMEVVREDSGVMYFKVVKNDGKYNILTGEVSYTAMVQPAFINLFNNFHKISSKNPAHYFTVLYGVLLAFLAISSFWMYKPGSGNFRRGIFISTTGVFVSILLLVF